MQAPHYLQLSLQPQLPRNPNNAVAVIEATHRFLDAVLALLVYAFRTVTTTGFWHELALVETRVLLSQVASDRRPVLLLRLWYFACFLGAR